MQIPVQIVPGKIPQFLDYFRVALGTAGYRGEGSFQPDGRFVEKVYCSIAVPSCGETPITWTVTWNPDGTLAPIDVMAEGGVSEDWQQVVERIVRTALVSTINAQKGNFFSRSQFAYLGPVLDGEYFIHGFRLAPAIPDDAIDFLRERIVYIDHTVEGVDREQAMSIGQIQANQIASLLSIFLGVGFYSIPIEKHWVLFNTKAKDSRCLQLGYVSPVPAPTSMPQKGSACRSGEMRKVDRSQIWEPPDKDNRLRCPDDIRELFRAVDRLPAGEREAYLGAAALYRVALIAGRHYPTVRMSYQVAAVDALNKGAPQKLESFVNLVQEYCPGVEESFARDAYTKIRSAHFHGGSFPGGEYEPMTFGPFAGPGSLTRLSLELRVHHVMRTVLVRWLLHNGRLNQSTVAPGDA